MKCKLIASAALALSAACASTAFAAPPNARVGRRIAVTSLRAACGRHSG
jgi:hypothetical protein